MGAIGVVFHVNPNASEAEQPGNDRVPSLMIGGLTASLAGVDRAQPDGALERLEFPAEFALMRSVQTSGASHKEGIGTHLDVALACDREGELVVRRSPHRIRPPPILRCHRLEFQ